jgi:glycosyltransferase involved in cell wall biosynthesis
VRILHLIPFLWSGAGDVVSRLAASQADAGHEVVVATSGVSRGQRDWPAYRRRLRQAGVAWQRIDTFDRQPEVFWTSQARLAALVGRWRPQVIHAHAGVPTCAAVLTARARPRRVPVVSQFYNWGPDRPAWMDDMDTTALRGADVVVCSATHYRTRLRQLGVPSARIRFVPWGLDDRWFMGSGPAPDPARPTIGFVGRIEPRKGQLDLVRAFAVLHKRLPAVRLELVGPAADPAYASAVSAEIDAAGLAGHARVMGHVVDVQPHVRRWSAFVSMSRDEGQGLAVLEAMASGVPVLSKPAPGVDDAVRAGRTGFVIPTGSASTQGAWLAERLGRPVELAAVARRAQGFVRGRYAWSATLEAIAAAYEAALPAGSSSEPRRRA